MLKNEKCKMLKVRPDLDLAFFAVTVDFVSAQCTCTPPSGKQATPVQAGADLDSYRCVMDGW